MKILFFCKRRPQGKDLLNRPYGRFFYLPKHLADKGHEIHILLYSYKNEPRHNETREGITWTSVSLPRHGPFAYIREAKKIIRQTKPDWLVGFSDTYYGIIAQRLGARHDIPSLIDAYDNYESYIPWLKPLHHLWRRSVARATLVTAAGPSLADLVSRYRPGSPTGIIGMAADPSFIPLDKQECRKKLSLSMDKKLIGCSGSTLDSSRGIQVLFAAYAFLKREHPEIELVLTGRKHQSVSFPHDANWLGYIPDAFMPVLLNSLDVLVVPNQASAFGNYSYPVKLYEAMCCEIPVVVANTLSTNWIMRHHHDLLVEPDNAPALCNKIKEVLDFPRIEYGEQPNWPAITNEFEGLLLKYGKP